MPQLSSSVAVRSSPWVESVQVVGAVVTTGTNLPVSPACKIPTRHANTIVGLVQNNCATTVTVRLRLYAAGGLLQHNGTTTGIAAGNTGTILYDSTTEPIADYAELIVTHAGAGGTIDVSLFARS